MDLDDVDHILIDLIGQHWINKLQLFEIQLFFVYLLLNCLPST
jgi:hypothetical protein